MRARYPDRVVPRAGGQNANAGMMPPSDSEEDSDDETKPSTSKAPAKKGQNANVGLMPPSDSEDEDEDSDTPLPEYLTQPSKPKK